MKKSTIFRFAGMCGVAALVLFALYRSGVLPEWGVKKETGAIILSGNIEAHESVLSFKTVQSRIMQLPFDEGQWVKQGTTVAVVDNRDLKQQIAIADAAVSVEQRQLDASIENVIAARKIIDADEAELAQRKLDLQRNRQLQKQGFVSTAALDNTVTALKQASAILERDRVLEQVAQRNVKVIRASLHNGQQSVLLTRIVEGYSTLNAPFDGVILERQAELGEVVAPGTPIVTMADLDHVWLRAYLNETDVGKVRLGQIATITTDTYPGKQFQGRLSFISSKAEYTPKSVETHAERITLVYRVKIDIDNAAHVFVPGMPADARLVAITPEKG
ncbi:MAG: HlyD family secretion protein [Burkholderiales bacterium]